MIFASVWFRLKVLSLVPLLGVRSFAAKGSGAATMGAVAEASPEQLQTAMACLSTENQQKLNEAFNVVGPEGGVQELEENESFIAVD